MKTYSNDPQDYTLEDMFSEKFDDTDWSDLTESMLSYFEHKPYAIDSFKEWWVEQQIKNHKYKEFD